MTTQLQPTTQPLTAFDITAERIEAAAAESFALKVKGIHDRRGLAKVERARIAWHEKLRDVERKRRELKAPLLEEIEKIDGAAKQIRSWIEPAESYLRSLVEETTRQRTQAERDAAGKRVAVIRERLALLAECGWTHYTPADVGPLSGDQFDELLAKARQQTRATSRPEPPALPVATAGERVADIGANAVRAGLAAAMGVVADRARAEDFAKLLHVANLVALIEVPQTMTKAGAEAAGEVATLLANCAERIRAAANLLTNAR